MVLHDWSVVVSSSQTVSRVVERGPESESVAGPGRDLGGSLLSVLCFVVLCGVVLFV